MTNLQIHGELVIEKGLNSHYSLERTMSMCDWQKGRGIMQKRLKEREREARKSCERMLSGERKRRALASLAEEEQVDFKGFSNIGTLSAAHV